VRECAEVQQVSAHGISRSLIPVQTYLRLLCGEDIDKTASERIEVICCLNVSMKGGSVKLCKNENPVDVGIDAIADRDIDESILSGERDCRFAALLRQRMQPGATTTAHDDCEYAFLGKHIRKGAGGLELASPLVGSINFAKQK
jgi:hypothetical protein